MSRCFPFPPPGYELKGRLDHLKEKEKPKKHKDKKEKKERSEKKEKKRGEDKHKEKKEKKKEKSERKDKESGEDKCKEDKKRKRENHIEKDKKKDKQSSAGEKRSVGSLENQNGQKLVLDGKPTDGIEEKRTVFELGNRVKSDGATSTQMVPKISNVEKEKAIFLGKAQAQVQAQAQATGNGILAINGQNLRVDSRSLGSGRNSYGENQIKVDEGKARNGYRNIVGEGDGSKNEDQNKNTKSKEKKGKEKKREFTEFRKDMVKHETSNGKFLDFHCKPRECLKENDDSRGKLPKLKEMNGFLHAKDSGVRPNNTLRPAVTSHQATQSGSDIGPSQNTTNMGMGAGKRAAVITDPKANGELSSPQSVIDSVGHTKTKNGLINHHNVLTNGVISPHIIRIERKMEPCQIVSLAKQTINGSIANQEVPQKVPLMENGGKMAVQMVKEQSIPSSVPLKGKERKEKRKERKERKDDVAITKPPHPDLKYLNQILTVPMLELPQIDDEEWLFERKDSENKRAKLDSPNSQSRKEVWSEAIHLESADVTALPYVIPY